MLPPALLKVSQHPLPRVEKAPTRPGLHGRQRLRLCFWRKRPCLWAWCDLHWRRRYCLWNDVYTS